VHPRVSLELQPRGANLYRIAIAALAAWIALRSPLVLAGEGAFVIERATTRLVDGVYRLDARINYQFSDAVVEALENGVPLTIEVQIEVHRSRWYWLDEDVAELSQFYLLQYHALSRQYLVTSLNSGAQRSFSSRYSALDVMGRMNDLPLLDNKLLKPDTAYQARMRVRLDIESLPSPLRPVAYLSDEWRLVSEWYEWSLNS